MGGQVVPAVDFHAAPCGHVMPGAGVQAGGEGADLVGAQAGGDLV